MYRFVLFLSTLVASVYGASIGERIIGGTDAPDGAFPYIASLQSYGRHFCGAVIINERWALTAAHCITSIEPQIVQLLVGTNKLDQGGKSYPVSRVIVNPSYNSLLDRNDIGLVELGEAIIFDTKVQPIPLPTKNLLEKNYPSVLSGWGSIRLIGGAYNDLQYVNVTIIDQSACLARSVKTTDANICTDTTNREGACYGDSGSPLVADGVLVGLVSWGTPCALILPDVHTRVWSFVDWINETIGV